MKVKEKIKYCKDFYGGFFISDYVKEFFSKGKDLEMDKIPCPACGGQTRLICALCIGEGFIYQPKYATKPVQSVR